MMTDEQYEQYRQHHHNIDLANRLDDTQLAKLQALKDAIETEVNPYHHQYHPDTDWDVLEFEDDGLAP